MADAKSLCFQIMFRHSFTSQLRRQSMIWAAKERQCEECGVPPNKPCLHKGDLKTKDPKFARVNVLPHTSRIDWEKLLKALKERGFTELE